MNVAAGQYKSDEVDIKVEKGAVTIVAAGDESYYLGEEIKLSGTNTETYKTYLFIVGPNLPAHGASLQQTGPEAHKVVTNSHVTNSRPLMSRVTTPGPGSGELQTMHSMQAPTLIYAVSQPTVEG